MSFRTYKPSCVDPALRLFCFPYAGGGAHVFSGWQEKIGCDIEVQAAQLRGRGVRFKDSQFLHFDDLLDEFEEATFPFLDQPYALFGHSLGGLIAFALALRLEKRGKCPLRLFLSGVPTPHGVEKEMVRSMTDEQLIAWLADINGTPVELLQDAEAVALVLPILRADLKLAETYTHDDSRKVHTSATIFGGKEDSQSANDLMEWQHLVTGTVTVEMLSGGHFFLHEREAEITRTIRRDVGLAPLLHAS